ncbi:DUF2523 domain-containing protein [Methylococcus mesophilus]|uniref:DUF2523 domain-containing protein n=1 Tax=Methylococcus mesophilus TaxID=2993564 RepID=UPI00224A6042|nr:DUF2523 domain-containing protein [Methylococcus mesophilus]UZR29442.1 DUF2523 domain-containing protein [Methylococcus mesophilus]
MGTLAQLLIGLASTLPGKVLSALGIGWLTFTGISAAADSVKGGLLSAWGSLPGDIMLLFGLAGVDQALGIITGAFVAKAAVSALPKLGKLVS